MTPDATVTDIKNRLTTLLPTYNIHTYTLPPKVTKDDSLHFPHILINVTGVVDNGMDRLTTYTLQVGLHNAYYKGQPSVLDTLESMYKYFVEATDLELRLPIRYTLSAEDNRPYFYGLMEIQLRSTTFR